MADKWVKRCKYEHPNPQRNPEYKDLGQNLAISGGASQDIKRLPRGWAKEGQYYTYANNSCAAGKVCGHYTQVIVTIPPTVIHLCFQPI